MGSELDNQKKAIAPPGATSMHSESSSPTFASPMQRYETDHPSRKPIDLQTQLNRAERFGHNLSQFQPGAFPPVHVPPVQRSHRLFIQPQLVEEEQKRDKEHEEQMQRKEDLTALLNQLPMPDLSPKDGGQPLPQKVQTKMEKSFGTSFSDVRIHEGPQAKSVGALAYTQGSRIHFAPGQYNPESMSGQALLGHELTHVVQQRAGRVPVATQNKGIPINADPALEQEADDMGAKAARGELADLPGRGAVGQMAQKRQEPMQHSQQPVQFFLVKLLVNALLKPALDLLFGDMGGGGGGGDGGGGAEAGGGGGADR
ncbi:MAG: DUF4157 domain-containing protein [Leptolyngbyaceae cyanobacterium bins.59]|nr:DUF4157 domain-containing protein [Leptolyngbyaceae cyanobacterium bins.59]